MDEVEIKSFYTFDCGCKFPIIDPTLKEDGLPSLDLDFDKINLNCPKAWCIFLEGKTKGVFQLEKSLGQHWSKLVSPTSLLEISDLISLMRPGTLGSKDANGKSMAQLYVDRKNGVSEAVPLDPALFEILKETQQVILYQESILEIAKYIAGFDLKEADALRKAVGKKDAAGLAKVRVGFIEKAKEKGLVTEEMANTIFDNIWASARYSFNKCIVNTTKVETVNGYTTLDECNIGDYITSPTGKTKILDKIQTGIKDVFLIELECGKTIECTINHKFLCSNGQIEPVWKILINGWEIVVE